MLKFTLLGSPQIALDEQSLSNEINGKMLALLVYLAVSEQMHTRDVLADLLWSEMPSSLARKNLRNTLYDLRALVDSHLVITRGDVLFNGKSAYWLDVSVFRRHLTQSQLQANPIIFQEVLNLYRGDFLAGFHVRNAPVFDEWMVRQRELLRSLVLQGLGWLTTYALQADDEEMGLAATNRLLALEPTAETAHRQRMWLLARGGHQSAALAQYAICQQMLAAELNITPAPETIELYEKIKSGSVCKANGAATYWLVDLALPPRAHRTPPAASPQQAWALPTQVAPVLPLEIAVRPPLDWGTIPQVNQFYGREYELTRLTQWLVGERCRLIGVFGMGGQGKTTLVARLVEQIRISIAPRDPPGHDAPAFQRIMWQSLADAPAPGEIILTWLQRLTNQPAATLPIRSDQQLALLFDSLQTQRCLCVLDNVEQIMRGGAQTDGYQALLRQFATSPHQSCLLLISRERPLEFTALEEENMLVRSLLLEGLALEASRTLLQVRGVASLNVTTSLHRRYAGHPLALTLVAEIISELFHGDGALFLLQAPLVFEQLRKILDQQFVRLDFLAQEILAWLALEDRALPVTAVWDCLWQPQSYTRFLEALRVLLRCSLVDNSQTGFALPAVMRAYIRQGLLETLQLELQATALPQATLNASMVDPAQTGAHFHTVIQRLRAQLGQANLWERLQPKLASLEHRPFAAPLPPHNLPRLLSHNGQRVEGLPLTIELGAALVDEHTV
jgi:DNA-binding SARP family transcriptional activator